MNVTFSGQLDDLLQDDGGAVYSGVPVGTDFSGAINHATLVGFISDGTTNTSLACCTDRPDGLIIENNNPLEAEDAAFVNLLTGSSFVAGDFIDLIILESGAMTPGGGEILIQLAMVFDASTFSDNSLDNYPPDPGEILASIFFIEETDDQAELIYETLSVIDEISFSDAVFEINAGLNDAWVSADAALQGFFFTVFPNLEFFFLSWFTFDSVPPGNGNPAVFGAPDQRWVTGLGAYSGDSVIISVELTSGGIFNGSVPLAEQQLNYGTIIIGFVNCSEAVLTYDFPSTGLSGRMTLTRVLPDNVALCQTLAGG